MKKTLERSVPAHRVVLYAIVASLLPVVLAIAWSQSTITAAETDRDILLALGEKIEKKGASQEANRLLIERYKNKDPLFLHRKIEPLSLLSSETSILRSRLARSVLPEDNQLEKRLNALNAENTLSFVEGSTDVSPILKETIENQTKPVEVDGDDLANILTLLEDQDENEELQKPHLIISEARIERRKGIFRQSWTLILKVIRREYI